MARLLLFLFFVAFMGFTAQAMLFGKLHGALPDPGQRIDSRNAILRKLFGKGEDMNKYEAEAFNWEDEYAPDFMPEEGEDMNKYEAEAFNWEDEYAPDFMPEEGNYNVLVRYAMKLGTLL
ncbi:unnamed protein product [Porites evermanni]|uniref:Uncharacterized protein n=1 Tax=Porites evermanni TaxID=104178 RepID=A0ABN8LS81_9CNID|nr:unnamed protein product [Porites evermanni]